MRIFVTGASGWIGSAVVPELIGAGHQVLGLARSDAGAKAVADLGAEVLRGDLNDIEVLRAGALDSGGVIHLAYEHALGQAGGAQTDARAIQAFATALAGSGRPLVISGATLVRPGRPATERDELIAEGPIAARIVNMQTALAASERGVRSSLVMLPRSVHGQGEHHGFIPQLTARARATGVSGYIGDGTSRWPAVHVEDAATLDRLAIEQAPADAVLYAVGEEGVAVREIAEAIGRHLNLPARSLPAADFGAPLAPLLGIDMPASSALTRDLLGWKPAHPASSRTSNRVTTSADQRAGLVTARDPARVRGYDVRTSRALEDSGVAESDIRSCGENLVRPAGSAGRGYVLRSAGIGELLGPPGTTDPDAIDALSSPERTRLDSSPTREAARRFLAGRLLLRELVAGVARVEPAAVGLRATCPDCGREHGRVLVREPAEARCVKVSLTHADGRVFAAATWGRGIGIDVEHAGADAERTAAIATVAGDADPDTGEDPDPIAHWTLVEATLKADGRGLRMDPRALTIRKRTGGEGVVVRVPGGGAYAVHQPWVGEAYRCSVALELAACDGTGPCDGNGH